MVYSTPIQISSSATIKAVAYKASWVTSDPTAGIYTITGTVAMPTFSPDPNKFTTTQSVTLTTETTGATIRYTTDSMTEPSETVGTIYTTPISVSSTMEIKAVAYIAGWETSQVNSGTYTIIQLLSYPSISAGYSHTVFLGDTTTVWAWGNNFYGQLGNGTMSGSEFYGGTAIPVQVLNLTDVVAIATGYIHTVALKSDGTVWAWGSNFAGVLGDGTTDDSLTPVQVVNLTDVVAVSAGFDHTLAVGTGSYLGGYSDGIWAWGWNGSGQLGDGTTENKSTPVLVQYPQDGPGIEYQVPISFSAGELHSAALTRTGSVGYGPVHIWTWGDNMFGQLGDGTTENKSTPVLVEIP